MIIEDLFREELVHLDNSLKTLEYSYKICKAIGIKNNYSLDESDRFESLTGRFSRTSDILIQKIFRIIDQLELEQPGSIIDRINRAEKRGMIDSAESFKKIRFLKNDIAHEYSEAVISEIYKQVIELTPLLIDSISKVNAYGDKFKL